MAFATAELRGKDGSSKHRRMNAKVRRFAYAAKHYQITGKLERQGAQAAGVRGHQVHGTFGSKLTQIRRNLGLSLAAPTRGRCLTSLLALRAGENKDPEIQLPTACLDQWLNSWRDHPELRAGVRQTWRHAVEHLRGVPEGQRTRHVRRPLTAVILHLMQAG